MLRKAIELIEPRLEGEKKMVTRVMLGLDFIGVNFPAALYTIQQWWNYTSQSEEYVCMLGISNFADRDMVLPGANELTPLNVLKTISAFVPCRQIAQWTSEIDTGLIEQLKRNGVLSFPFYSGFNYGSVVNRLLLLATAYDCEYLVRVDPGTLPPETLPPNEKTFAELMAEHKKEIDSDRCTVVSRCYDKRLALRDMFVKKNLDTEHANKVKEFTGINVYAQVTGGAMLTFKTPGIPAVCMPDEAGLTLVWASDDGIYSILDCREPKKSKMLTKKYPVKRFDAEGKPKKPKEYYRGILGAVYLKAIRDGKDNETAQQNAEKFIKELADDVLDPEKCSKIDSDWHNTFVANEIAPEAFVKVIRNGWNNHRRLLSDWEKICMILRPIIVKETSANNRIDSDRK